VKRASTALAHAASGLVLALAPCLAGAHEGEPHARVDWLADWSAPPGVVWPIVVAAVLYAAGARRLWQRAGTGRGLSRWRAAAFAAGLATLVLALMSPLDAIAATYFSLHMVQHLLLILAAAPLLVLGTPEVAVLWAMPARWRGALGRIEHTLARSIVGPAVGGGRGPVLVLVVATGVLWAWHSPQLYELAAHNDAVHTAEHAAFLVTSILFWATVLRVRASERLGNGLRVLYVFAMTMQGSVLGALLTFARLPLYASHVDAAGRFGFDALADQQLAGLVMWIPPAALYIGVIAYLLVTWFDGLARRRLAPGRV
jgi:cytochrome c oxidase assembly factor CtaG